MKKFILLPALFGLLSCHEHVSKSLSGKSGSEMLTCETSADRPLRAVIINQKIIELVRADLQGRPYSRNSFWSRLSRETRVALNLLLNSQIGDLRENDVYRGTALFFEKHTLNGSSSLALVSGGTKIIFQAGDAAEERSERECEDSPKLLQQVSIEKVIPLSTLESLRSCEVSGLKLNLEIYKNHLAIRMDEKIFSFAGGELIVQRTRETYKVSALNADHEKLELTLGPDSKVKMSLAGDGRSLSGTGTCH